MLTRILFESLWLLAAVWVGGQFLLIALWSWRRSRLTARMVWAGFAAGPLLWVMSALVVTPRERIVEQCEELADYVDQGDIAAITRHLHDDFAVADFDRESFADRLEQMLTRHRIDRPRLRSFDVEFSKDGNAVAEFNASALVRVPDLFSDRVDSHWRVIFRQDGDRWLITKIEGRPAAPFEGPNFAGWLR